MQKILYGLITIVLIIVFAAVGCGKKEAEDSSENASTNTPQRTSVPVNMTSRNTIVDNRPTPSPSPTLPLDTKELLTAIQNDDLKEVESILSKTPELVNTKDTESQTALMYAVAKNKPQIVKLLIEKGADVNMVEHSGVTALMIAVVLNMKPMVELLVENGADLTIKDNSGKTALKCATERKYKDIADYLSSKGGTE